MRRLIAVALLVAAAAASGGCYAKHENNQWWACEDYQTPNGVATGCTPINF